MKRLAIGSTGEGAIITREASTYLLIALAVMPLWNLDGSPRGAPLEGHLAAVRALGFQPGSGLLVSGGNDRTVRFWKLPGGESEVLDIGIPVDQLGFWRSFLWVRAGGEWIYVYDAGRRRVATMHLSRDAVLTFTADGWISGSGDAVQSLRAFGADGAAPNEAQTVARVSPEQVLRALTDASR